MAFNSLTSASRCSIRSSGVLGGGRLVVGGLGACRGRAVFDHQANDPAIVRDDRSTAVPRSRDRRVEEGLLPGWPAASGCLGGRIDHLTALHGYGHPGDHRHARVAEHVDIIVPGRIAERHGPRAAAYPCPPETDIRVPRCSGCGRAVHWRVTCSPISSPVDGYTERPVPGANAATTCLLVTMWVWSRTKPVPQRGLPAVSAPGELNGDRVVARNDQLCRQKSPTARGFRLPGRATRRPV